MIGDYNLYVIVEMCDLILSKVSHYLHIFCALCPPVNIS